MSLAACPSCRRLVRASDAECPFCAAKQPTVRPNRRPILGRMSRSALLVTAAVTLGGPVETCRKMLGFDSGVQAAYGAVPPPPTTMALPAYGLPPPPPPGPDAGPTIVPADAGAPKDAGAKAAPRDAGSPGSIAIPPYGVPPRDR